VNTGPFPASRQVLKELEKVNEGLSAELREKNQEVVKLSQKPSSTTIPKPTSIFSRTFSSLDQNLNVNKSPEMAQLLLRKNTKLEVKLEELRDRLAKAHKNVHILQVTKEKMQSRLNQRQDELLSELEESRARNRQLQSQIHYIRTTYHELFPADVFNSNKIPGRQIKVRKLSQTLSKEVRNPHNPGWNVHATTKTGDQNARQKSSRTISPPKSKSQQNPPIEALISQTKTWVTGQKTSGAGHLSKIGERFSDEFTDDEGDEDNLAAAANPGHDMNQRGQPASTTISELEDPSES